MKIEKGIQAPTETKSPTHILRQMGVGDSILITDCDPDKKNLHAGFRISAKRLGLKVAARKVEGGLRIWRTK